jgi:1-deoxy-D-xylulose-5-phosphate reductoisomerase
MKRVLILGSTGSIGVNALKVIKDFPDKFSVEGLTSNSNIELLEEQIKQFKPNFVSVKDKNKAIELSKKINHSVEILIGQEGILQSVSYGQYDILIGAIVGFAGLQPTLEAIKRGKRIALANKETLVVAGEIVTRLVAENNAEIIPVDSEHSAIYQCLIGENLKEVEKIILTASGGPFYNKDKSFFDNATVDEALNHPNWKMGNKITIDSATMMNKGLEIIEAHWLFGLPAEKINVVIHPQSIIHSMVQFVDGSIKAQLGLPDMKIPIQYALSFPERFENKFDRTDLPLIKSFSFFEPDFDKFECLNLAYQALKRGGNSPCVLNAANEIAVEKFLKKKIKFSDVSKLNRLALEKIEYQSNPNFEQIVECDIKTRNFVNSIDLTQ